MPEGDTLFRTAATLRPMLEGRTIVAAEARREDDGRRLINARVTRVEARGKHLLLHLADRGAIHSHLGMTGSWHSYGVGESWQKLRHRAELVLRTDAGREIVCFSPKQLEILSADGLRRHPWLAHLGPDMLANHFQLDELVPRFRAREALPVGVAVMDQRIVCGIGNVYKSEILFLERISPFRSVAGLSDDQLRGVLKKARYLMRRNLAGSPRTTRFRNDGGRQWVYGRSGQPCYECGTVVVMRRQGDLGRSTYFCSKCQRVGV